MSAAVTIAWRLLRGGGRRGLIGAGLTLAAVAVSTAFLMFTVAVNVAFEHRADREAWRNPVPADAARAVAVQGVRRDFFQGRMITVAEVAALRPGVAPPPGAARFPAPGEAWLSPALAALVRETPPDRLGGRFPNVAGTLAGETLVHPGELVAVLGRAPDDPALAPGRGGDGVAPTPVADFTGRHGADAVAYQSLALVAGVLMVVPLLVFSGAAARLTVARRDQRLAALRLVGATPGQVVGMTVVEAILLALAGAVAGVAGYLAMTPLLARITVAGGTWFVADLWPGVLITFGVLLAVPLLVGASAVLGLRRVVVSPLGVARRETPPGMRVLRVVAFLAVVGAFPVLGRGNAGVVVVAVALALPFLAVNLVGPWVVALIGRVMAGTARRPAWLLAGRRLVDDPRSAWRTVGGVALTGFVAGFVGLLSPSAGLLGDAPADRLRLGVPAAQAATVQAGAERRLRAAGVPARVTVTGTGDRRLVEVTPEPAATPGSTGGSPREGSPEVLERARTALDGLVPGRGASTPAEDDLPGMLLLGDIRTGTVVVLAVSLLVATTSAGITAASSVLDRRQTYALLRLAGTPLSVLDRARRSETLVPLVVMGGGSVATGMFCALPFVYAGLNVTGVLALGVCVVGGFAGVVGAGALSSPLLRSVTANPGPRPD
ncbi:hypothetical protein Misp01_59150 [Microtetraspora sp. NBRC 13810]|uniref:FtsX-like permease family protein n=1 Tax=Microtetraspora sp. NBRC 13810 TaxID=3030990 RepID=UPI0024A02E5A|nr:FtsX-like permease family protein [Microtetraspora sp. NBRC 13810]GLW10787.1 hypothetical protein Misp01_59150 [Microtetraspora sp. NBRC 13810]